MPNELHPKSMYSLVCIMSFIHQIGSGAYISVNVGSGTPQEAADWMEYMTAAAPTTLAKERAANGHPAPYKVGFMGIGNESWSCGGDMTADYYLSQLKIYSRFVHNDNPLQHGANHMLEIAVGPGVPETNWTETIMKAWQHHEGLAASRRRGSITTGVGISVACRCTGIPWP